MQIAVVSIGSKIAILCPNCERFIFLPKKKEIKCAWGCGFETRIKKSMLKKANNESIAIE